MTHTVLLLLLRIRSAHLETLGVYLPLSHRRCFCAVQNYVEKAELSKCSWYPKRKLGLTMHFSEIIKLQFGKEPHTLLFNYLRKPQFSFWISGSIPRKNTFELVGTVLNFHRGHRFFTLSPRFEDALAGFYALNCGIDVNVVER